jgi:tetratricopeptide (TPR) repeat protein
MKIHKKHDQAEKHYKKALELEPNNAAANGNYALFLMKIHKKHDQAEKHYKKALKLEPDNPTLLTLPPFLTTHPIALSPAVDNQDNVPNDKTIIQPIDFDV